MAPSKPKETLLELCTTTIALGNGIAVHTLEYLSISKRPRPGFKECAIEFLESSRALFPAKAGLARSNAKFPPDVSQELRDRFTQTRNAFSVMDQMVNKLLSGEKKQGFGKLGKGFRLMLADGEIDKLRLCLAQCRAAMSISALMFSSVLGDGKLDAAAGIGYTALAAILETADPTRAKSTSSPLTPHEIAIADLSPDRRPLPPAPHIDTYAPRSSSLRDGYFPSLPEGALLDRQTINSPTSTMSAVTHMKSPFSDRSSVIVGNPNDNASDITSITSMLSQENGGQYHAIGDKIPKQPIRIKVDPSKTQRWTPKRNTVPISEQSKAALTTSIQQKDHKTSEQLLDCGVPPEVGHMITAIVNHDLESVRLLLLFGADANAKDKDGSTPLYTATGHSFFEAAQLLVKYGADSNLCAGPYGESPFAVSLTGSKSHFVHLYLQYGADPNQIMGNGDTPFTQAMNKSTPTALVDLMIVYDADVNGKNGRGETPLFKAINDADRHDLVTILLDHGADPNMPGPKIVLWPAVHHPQILEVLLERGSDLRRAPGVLELATSINSRRAVDLLLKFNVDLNAKKDGIYTPLCSAIRDNREELVDLLLASGADPNCTALELPVYKCVTYHRPHFLPRLLAAGANLHSPKGVVAHAVKHNDKEALAFLLKHGCDINVRNSVTGQTALTTAIKENRLDMIDILLQHGANPAIRGQDWPVSMAVKNPEILQRLLPHIPTTLINKGAVEMAVVADQLESVKLLISKGVSVEDKNGGVFSPLATSIRENRKEIFRYLVDEADADVNAPGEHLPIIKAIRRHRENDMSYIEHLLICGADINLMYRGWNAVLQALDNGDMQILKLLATKGHPDISARDEHGRSVQEIMQERGLEEEMQVLLSSKRPSRRSSPEIKEALSSLRELVL
ncbi:hypothetical protein M409DRAFT_22703 [Zasmidium cellare ATCC 36951]|uniref:Uncharacterized protein n=1 Tax=Zasmidium cellare ATCC 36951 TaxID=1080233 RepID=A0A6A6CP68_ZASCE|nr:uncharacterized protein M409DRAFT_22703 [Zasmidium cellare ATCC 36951]KAF2167276.1 hypothetical protein M409DRAFT_22703 [Zasmidium cellare ATCC 36951]